MINPVPFFLFPTSHLSGTHEFGWKKKVKNCMHSIKILAFLLELTTDVWPLTFVTGQEFPAWGIFHPVNSQNRNTCKSSSNVHYCCLILTKIVMHQQILTELSSIKFCENQFTSSSSFMCTEREMDIWSNFKDALQWSCLQRCFDMLFNVNSFHLLHLYTSY